MKKSTAKTILGVILAVILLACCVALCFTCTGCVYKGAKVTEGTDLAIGLNVPCSEGTLQLQVINYLSGFRLGVDRNAILTCHYTVSETNSYLGVVHTHVTKTMDATVEPCETTPTTTNTVTVVTVPTNTVSTIDDHIMLM